MTPRLTETSYAPHRRDTLPKPDSPLLAEVAPDESGLGRAFVWGSVIGGAAVWLVCGAVSLIAGTSPAAALGIGAFAAFWGGPGFGGMLGAVLHHSRAEGLF